MADVMCSNACTGANEAIIVSPPLYVCICEPTPTSGLDRTISLETFSCTLPDCRTLGRPERVCEPSPTSGRDRMCSLETCSCTLPDCRTLWTPPAWTVWCAPTHVPMLLRPSPSPPICVCVPASRFQPLDPIGQPLPKLAPASCRIFGPYGDPPGWALRCAPMPVLVQLR